VGNFFPTNPLFVEWAATISAGSRGLFLTVDGWQQLARFLLLGAPAAVLCWLVIMSNALRRRPEAVWCAAGIVAIGTVWYESVTYTGGGLFYSMRVLSPAFALGAVFGGCALARGDETPARTNVRNFGLGVLLIATLPMTLTLPHNAFKLSPVDWPRAGQGFVDERRRADQELSQHLQRLPDHGRILTECVSLPRALLSAGIAAVPVWSPEVAWLFDRRIDPGEIARRWRESGIRYFVMTRSPAQLELLARRAAWTSPNFVIKRTWQSDGYVVFDVTAPPLPHQ
jgi:hypothetical protein